MTVQFHYDALAIPQWKVFVTGVTSPESAREIYCQLVDFLSAEEPNPYAVKATDIQHGLIYEITKENA